MTLRRLLFALLLLPLLGLAAFALRAGRLQAARTTVATSTNKLGVAASALVGMLPPGALLTIETPDFAGLLRSWSESAAWMRSGNYSFSPTPACWPAFRCAG